MSDWFTVEKIDNETFAISEYRHWEETHCYLLLGSASAVLIDTGLGIGNIKDVVDSLTSLPIIVMTTHVHWDHIGGHKYFENIAVHEAERGWITDAFPLSLETVKKNLTASPCDFPQDFQIDSYQVYQGAPQRTFRDNDCIDLGSRQIRVVHTPGHSPGHCCFYEPDKKYLYSGDLVYKGCLDAFYPTTDPQLFLKSLAKVCALETRKVLPAHHQLHIPVKLIQQIEQGFRNLDEEGKLKQGSGCFHFPDFQIHI